MRVLLDECVDWRLSRDIVGHDVMTAHQMGWATIKNGELLARASAEFDVVNMPAQQNIGRLPLAVVVLRSRTNRLADLMLLISELLQVLSHVRPGTISVVGRSGR